MNYRMINGAIVFRTGQGSKLSAASSGAVVAFAIDGHDLAERLGWSVLVAGRSEVVHDLDVTFKVLDAGLEPLAGGRRRALVRITPEFVSGRRIVKQL